MGKRRQAETASDAKTCTTAASAGDNRADKEGWPADPSGTATTEEALRHEIVHAALTSAKYHSMRETFFTRMHRLVTAIQALAATAAFAAISNILPNSLAAWLAFVVALAAVVALVWSPSERARDHHDLRRRFYDIYARAEAAKTEKELHAIRRDMRLIYADEPPPSHKAIEALAYNAAIDAIYQPDEARAHKIRVGWLRSRLANLLPFHGWDTTDA